MTTGPPIVIRLWLVDLLEGLLRGALLVGLALVVGGVTWALTVLRAWRPDTPGAARRRCIRLAAAGAIAVACCQASLLAVKAAELYAMLGSASLADLAATAHFRAGVARALIAIALALGLRAIDRASRPRPAWLAMGAGVIALAASAAWLSHASSRLQDRGLLMGLTAAHQAASAMWLGGLVQLVAVWRLGRQDPTVDAWRPVLLSRFSWVATAGVAAVVVTALPLARLYVGSPPGLAGSGYGSLVVTKAALLAAAVSLGACNLAIARGGWRVPLPLRRALLPLVEAEAILLVATLFAASTLSALPPPVDLPASDQASVAELVETFRPKVPALRTPSLAAMRRDEAMASAERSRDAYLWSNFSHNVSGLILLGTAGTALVGALVRRRWAWPWLVGFLGLALFVYLRATANEGTWPLGPNGVWPVTGEGLQHRIAAGLVLGLGVIEWRVRAAPARAGRWRWAVPALAAAGALLLLTHSHAAFEGRARFLVQVTHTAMGALAVVMVVGRWMELRLPPAPARIAGAISTAAMLGVALVLVFYREANVVPD
jgi:putative copper resistance protein D